MKRLTIPKNAGYAPTCSDNIVLWNYIIEACGTILFNPRQRIILFKVPSRDRGVAIHEDYARQFKLSFDFHCSEVSKQQLLLSIVKSRLVPWTLHSSNYIDMYPTNTPYPSSHSSSTKHSSVLYSNIWITCMSFRIFVCAVFPISESSEKFKFYIAPLSSPPTS